MEQYLKCGKSPCCCKGAGHPGHGPYFAFTRKVEGKTQTRQFRPGPALAKLCREVEIFHRFRRLSDQLIEINERICELRPVGADPEAHAVKKPRRGPPGGSGARNRPARDAGPEGSGDLGACGFRSPERCRRGRFAPSQ